MNPVRFGIIGAGGAWAFHGNAAKGSSLLSFNAVYDSNILRAQRTAKRYKGGEMVPYGDLDEMLAGEIDAVLIMVPHIYHQELAERAAEAGKHVLCEKPMATTLEGCDRMTAAAEKNGVKLMIAENHRFLPAHLYIRDAVRNGLLGEISHVRAYEGVNEIAGLSEKGFWKGDPAKAGGGSFMDMGAHKFAVLEWILDDQVSSVYAHLSKQVIPLAEKAEDNAMAICRFSRGVMAEICVSFTQFTPPFNSLEIHGSKGTILENHLWENPVRILSFDESMGERRGKWFEPEIEHAAFPQYYSISVRHTDEHFARCILEDEEPEFSPEAAKSAIAGVMMGYLSAHTGREATRTELLELASENGSDSLLGDLPEVVRLKETLEEVKTVEPVGFDKKRARDVMKNLDLDLLVATSPANVYYLTGFPALPTSPNPILHALKNHYPSLAMMNREGDLSLVGWEGFGSVDEFCWTQDYKGVLGLKDVRNGTWSKIKKWGLVGKRIGLEPSAPWFLAEHLKKKDPEAEFVAMDEAFIEMRLIKSEEEIRRITEATRITEAAVQRCLDEVDVGMTDNELLALARRTMTQEGADGWDHLTLSIGDSDPEAPGTGRKVEKGDLVRFDFGAAYRGYVGDVNRHVFMGPVPEGARDLNGKLILFQEFFEKNIRSGVGIKELHREALEYYKAVNPDSMTLFIGHSIGLECEEAHLFGPMGLMDRNFEENMVFEIEAWEPFGGMLVGVEDCYVVTAEDCRKITTLDKRILAKEP